MIRLPGAHADNLTMPAALLSRAPQVPPNEMTESGASELTSPPIDDIFDT